MAEGEIISLLTIHDDESLSCGERSAETQTLFCEGIASASHRRRELLGFWQRLRFSEEKRLFFFLLKSNKQVP